jgi:hypothetical protein
MIQKHHHDTFQPTNNPTQQSCYYISNLSLSLKNTDYMIYKEHLIQSIQTLIYLQKVRKPTLKEL